MKGAKRYAITKITDRPKRRLEAMVDLREEVLAISTDIAERVENLHNVLQNQQYDHESDEGLLELEMRNYLNCFVANKVELNRLIDQEMERIQEEM